MFNVFLQECRYKNRLGLQRGVISIKCLPPKDTGSSHMYCIGPWMPSKPFILVYTYLQGKLKAICIYVFKVSYMFKQQQQILRHCHQCINPHFELFILCVNTNENNKCSQLLVDAK